MELTSPFLSHFTYPHSNSEKRINYCIIFVPTLLFFLPILLLFCVCLLGRTLGVLHPWCYSRKRIKYYLLFGLFVVSLAKKWNFPIKKEIIQKLFIILSTYFFLLCYFKNIQIKIINSYSYIIIWEHLQLYLFLCGKL